MRRTATDGLRLPATKRRAGMNAARARILANTRPGAKPSDREENQEWPLGEPRGYKRVQPELRVHTGGTQGSGI